MKSLRQGGFLIAKIHQLAGRIFARMLKEYGIEEINPAQGRILFALWQKDGIPIQELSERTSLEKSTLTSMLDRLEHTGYIVRTPCSNDRRKILIRLTEKNEQMKEAYERVSAAMTGLFYRGFTEDEIDRFETCLERIFANLAAHERKKDKRIGGFKDDQRRSHKAIPCSHQ